MRPQSTLLLNVPKVSAAQWHPFTVAAVRPVNGATLAELHIKPRGKWAQASVAASSATRLALALPAASTKAVVLALRALRLAHSTF